MVYFCYNGYEASFKKIVFALLNEIKNLGAEFATVSGRLDNVTEPLKLYKSCGFVGDDVWYICRAD